MLAEISSGIQIRSPSPQQQCAEEGGKQQRTEALYGAHREWSGELQHLLSKWNNAVVPQHLLSRITEDGRLGTQQYES